MHKLSLQTFQIQDQKLNELLNKTYTELGKLSGMLELLPYKELLLSPLLVMESVKSSNIESINSTILEQLQLHAKGRKIYSSEQKQTENYRQAILLGYEYIQKNNKFDIGLIELVQRTLEPNLSGIRDNQNVVIANNYTGEILWEPPKHKEVVIDYLQDWLECVNNINDGIDGLVKVAILHSQFEAIHPFVDGNGRTGRILITLYLVFVGLLSYPCLYLSEYILRTRTYYYLNLKESQTNQNHYGIAEYLIQGIYQKTKFNCNLIILIANKKDEYRIKLREELPKIYSSELLEYLFQSPFYSIGSMCVDINLTRNTASKYLSLLMSKNFVELYESKDESKKSKLFYNPVLLSVLK